MVRPRLTLAGALGIVAILALGLAGMRSATTFWTSAAATVTLALFLSAILGVCLLKGTEQVACLGFAMFGLVYLVLVNWDWIGAQFGHDLTAGLGDLADSLVPLPPMVSRANPNGPPILVGSSADLAERQVRVGNFVQISRMALALLFGVAGAYAAVVMRKHRDQLDVESSG